MQNSVIEPSSAFLASVAVMVGNYPVDVRAAIFSTDHPVSWFINSDGTIVMLTTFDENALDVPNSDYSVNNQVQLRNRDEKEYFENKKFVLDPR